jgi:hypothetical protein
VTVAQLCQAQNLTELLKNFKNEPSEQLTPKWQTCILRDFTVIEKQEQCHSVLRAPGVLGSTLGTVGDH